MPFIYRIINLQNSKSYVGASGNPSARWRHHKSALNRGRHSIEFVLDWQEYGEENFQMEILEECESVERLIERETYWISHYNSVKNGYNQIYGSTGNSGGSLSSRTRSLMSAVRKGRAKSDEWKAKIKEGLKKYHERKNERKIAISL